MVDEKQELMMGNMVGVYNLKAGQDTEGRWIKNGALETN